MPGIMLTLFSAIALAGSVDFDLEVGETTTITLEGKDYTFTVDGIADDLVLLTVNGEKLPALEEGDDYTLMDGAELQVWDVEDDSEGEYVELELWVPDVKEAEEEEIEWEDEWDVKEEVEWTDFDKNKFELQDIIWDAVIEYVDDEDLGSGRHLLID